MSEEDKERRGRSRGVPEGEPPEDKAAKAPESGPMGTGDPEAGDSGLMGTKSAEPNEDAASSDRADGGDD